MKKSMLVLSAALALVLSSCSDGGSFESDIRKSAKLECEINKLEKKADTDEKAKADLEKKEKEKDEFEKKMEEKYKGKEMENDPKMQAKAMEIMMEEMKKCGALTD